MIYIAITEFVFEKLITASVIFGFIRAQRETEGVIESDAINLLFELWTEYDQNATGWIEVVDVVFLIYELPTPLGKAEDYKELQQ